MALTHHEQFKRFLDTSKEILILIPENPSADAVGTAWALYFYLEKTGAIPTIAFANHMASKFEFLNRPERILSEISGARDFVLSFDISKNKIKNIRHEEADGKFTIYLTPERGSIDPRDFSFILAKFKYDLVVVIDAPDLEKLGPLYLNNTDLFFEVPVVNIDHLSGNDNFGQINLVNVTASSSAEIIAEFLEGTAPALTDKTIATCLLTGIIGATDSFQNKNTTPKAMSLASRLMEQGANQQEIIRWLYKTQPLHILKLWGRLMAKLYLAHEGKLVWSPITLQDFVESRASVKDLGVILEKLEENYTEGQIFAAVINDTPTTSVALIRFNDPKTLKKVQLILGGEIKQNLLEVKLAISDIQETGKTLEEKIKQIVIV